MGGAGSQGQPFALTEGYHAAFVVALGFGVLGLIAALSLLGRRGPAAPLEAPVYDVTSPETTGG